MLVPNPIKNYLEQKSIRIAQNNQITIPYDFDNLKLTFLNNPPVFEVKDNKSFKGSFFKSFVNHSSKKKGDYDLLLAQKRKSNAKLLASFETQGYKAIPFTMKTQSRMMIGMGGNSPFELSLTLDHVFGYPIIPSSSLKGLCRAWLTVAEDEFEAKTYDGIELEKLIDEKAYQVFGSSNEVDDKNFPNKVGDVLFLDAIPTKLPTFAPDIMTPHFTKYFEGNLAPTETENPTPIPFLTVEKGAEFEFYLMSKKEDSLKYAIVWLLEGLTNLGIGAKTSLGYGLFEQNELTKKLYKEAKMTKAQQEEDEKQKIERENAERITKEEEFAKQLQERRKMAKEIAANQPITEDYFNLFIKDETDVEFRRELSDLFFKNSKDFIKNKRKRVAKDGKSLPDYLRLLLEYKTPN